MYTKYLTIILSFFMFSVCFADEPLKPRDTIIIEVVMPRVLSKNDLEFFKDYNRALLKIIEEVLKDEKLANKCTIKLVLEDKHESD